MKTLKLCGFAALIFSGWFCSVASAATCSDDFSRSFEVQCLEQAVGVGERDIQTELHRLLERSDPERKKLLLASQRAWAAYRNEQCALEFDLTRAQHYRYSQHGTASRAHQLRRKRRLNEERLIVLQATQKMQGKSDE